MSVENEYERQVGEPIQGELAELSTSGWHGVLDQPAVCALIGWLAWLVFRAFGWA